MPSATASPTETSTFTPEPTNTPQKTYNCPKRLSLEAQMSHLTLKGDIQTGDFARWVTSRPESKAKISANPQNLNYENYTKEGTDNNEIHLLSAESTTKPGWVAKHSATVAVCKIDPKEFGLENKNGNNTFIVATIMEDKNGRRAPQIMFASRRFLENWGQVWFDDPTNGFDAIDDLDTYADPLLILKGAKPQGPDDLRVLEKDEIFYNAQGITKEQVDDVFQKVADTDIFSDDVVVFFSTTILHIGPYHSYVP